MKTLKCKMLGKKVMLSLLTAGVLTVGVCGSAFAADVTYDKDVTGYISAYKQSVLIKGDSITVDNTGNAKPTVGSNSVAGILVSVDSDVNFSGKDLTVISTRDKAVQTHGIRVESRKGSDFNKSAVLNIGSENQKAGVISITSNVYEKHYAIGLAAHNQSGSGHDGPKVNINADKLIINANSTGYVAYGILAQNSTTDYSGNVSTININANDIEITAISGSGEASAISAISQSKVNIEGNLTAKGDNVLATRGNASTKINVSEKNSVKLDGNIIFSYDDKTSKTGIDASVDIRLTDSKSYLNGKITKDSDIDPIPNGKDDVSGMKLTIANGAQWNATGDSFVNTLTMNKGIVNLDGDTNIDIDNLEGSGAIFNMPEGKASSETSITVDNLNNIDVTLNGGNMILNNKTTIKGSLTLNKGAMVDVGNLEGQNSDNSPRNLTLASTAKLRFDDLSYYEKSKGESAIYVTGDFKAEKGAKVIIDKVAKGTYRIVTAGGSITNEMSADDASYTSGIMEAKWVEDEAKDENEEIENILELEVVGVTDLSQITSPNNDKEGKEEIIPLVTSENKDFLQEAAENAEKLAKNPETKGFADLINAVQKMMAEAGNSAESIKLGRAAFAGALQSVEAGGATSTAVSIVNNVAGVTGGHMSMATPSTSGGKGVGLMDAGSGAGVWAQYVHGKDKAEKMLMNGGSTKYNNSYNGIVVGADFKQVSKFQSGVAFNYVDGDGSSVFNKAISGHTDFKAYGLTYYGAIKNDTANTMFDVSYNRSKAESKQENLGGEISATQKTNTWSAGVTVEKAFRSKNNGAQVIPYVGARYMRIGTDDYANSIGVKTAIEDQNIFLIPVGVKMRQENKLKSGWTITPKMDLSYVWALGDTDNDMTVSAPGLNSTSRLGYTVMDNGSFLGTIGLEASKSNWTYGLSFSYQKGEYQQSKKYFVDVNYTF